MSLKSYKKSEKANIYEYEVTVEAEAFEKDRNEASKKYGFTSYYVLENYIKEWFWGG